MTFTMPPSEPDVSLEESLYKNSLPQVRCAACEQLIARRKHRVFIRASWRDASESLCAPCWTTLCQWAARFALVQGELDLS